jgi:uncharacterized glyoxalase superfamily protein PhnB
MNISKVTPILFVDSIEASLLFWEKQLGYEKVVEIPHEDRLGFVILSRAGAGELMLQTRASLAADLPAIAALEPDALLYVDVDSVEIALKEAGAAKVLVPPRDTFYGAREAAVVEPSGQIVVFSKPKR